MVYVLNQDGVAIMPTKNHAKVRVFLKQGKAKVVRRTPFTIQLLYSSTNYTQDISLGVDAGSKKIGLSATTPKKEYYASNVILKNDIVDLLSTRRELRRSRRNRKTRYREKRFNNRKRQEGWLAPSIRQKIESHLKVVENVHKLLPISKIIVEVAAFDTQLLKAKDYGDTLPQGTDYQNGEMKGFNTREYVLFRDGHKCRCCKGKSKDNILQTHHIESRKTGGNAPNNLVTLCKTCHEGYHNGTIKLPDDIKRGNSYKDAAFMGIMRWAFYDELKNQYPDVSMTYGYITKHTRIENDLPKDHYIDARCISGNPNAEPLGHIYIQKKVRCHNRQIHKCKIQKGGTRKRNQADYMVKGFRLYDKVLAKNKEWYIHGRRVNGSFVLKNLSGESLEIVPSKIKTLSHQHNYIIEKVKVG